MNISDDLLAIDAGMKMLHEMHRQGETMVVPYNTIIFASAD
jgi:hypothetical protein